jgi:hypothetical protein
MNGKAVLDSNTIMDLFNGLIPLESFKQALTGTEQIISVIIEFRRRTNKKLPDSIIAATSIVSNATLITRDKELFKLHFPGLRSMQIADSYAAC